MADIPTCTWIGATGTRYVYLIYPRHPSFTAGQDGNYIYARHEANNTCEPVYIGQGDLSARATKDHHQIECIDSKSATHVHVHLNKNETDRLAEEKDLLANYPQAYVPKGCNVKKGG